MERIIILIMVKRIDEESTYIESLAERPGGCERAGRYIWNIAFEWRGRVVSIEVRYFG